MFAGSAVVSIAIFALICLTNSVVAYQGSHVNILRKMTFAPKLSKSALNLSTADFKNGMTFEIDGVPSRLIEFLHVKPGKGSAFVRTKCKNLLNGSVQDRTFRAGESVVAADISKIDMQYTFTDGSMICFMNMETFEEERMEAKKMDEKQIQLLKEGLDVKVTIWNEQVIGVDLPQQVSYTVVDTPPNFKGNTASSGSTKPAVLDCGATVNVPMFIENGEVILVSTEEIKYLQRFGGYTTENKDKAK
jgi:elongation factor P